MDMPVAPGEQEPAPIASPKRHRIRRDSLRRINLEAMLLSLVIIACGMTLTWRIGKQANELDHRLYHITENLEGVQTNIQRLLDRNVSQVAGDMKGMQTSNHRPEDPIR